MNTFQGWQSLRSNSIICHLWQSIWLFPICQPAGILDRITPSWGVCGCVEWRFNAVIRQSEEHLDFLRWQQLYRASPHKVPSYLFATIIKWVFSVLLCVRVWVCERQRKRICVCAEGNDMRAQKDQHEKWVDPGWGQKYHKDFWAFYKKNKPILSRWSETFLFFSPPEAEAAVVKLRSIKCLSVHWVAASIKRWKFVFKGEIEFSGERVGPFCEACRKLIKEMGFLVCLYHI